MIISIIDVGHAACTILFLFTGNWWSFLFNLPLVCYRAYEFQKKIYLFSPATVAPLKGHASGKVSVIGKLGATIAFYSLMALYYAYRMIW